MARCATHTPVEGAGGWYCETCRRPLVKTYPVSWFRWRAWRRLLRIDMDRWNQKGTGR